MGGGTQGLAQRGPSADGTLVLSWGPGVLPRCWEPWAPVRPSLALASRLLLLQNPGKRVTEK